MRYDGMEVGPKELLNQPPEIRISAPVSLLDRWIEERRARIRLEETLRYYVKYRDGTVPLPDILQADENQHQARCFPWHLILPERGSTGSMKRELSQLKGENEALLACCRQLTDESAANKRNLDGLLEELEDLTQCLFEQANSMVSKEIRLRHEVETRYQHQTTHLSPENVSDVLRNVNAKLRAHLQSLSFSRSNPILEDTPSPSRTGSG